MEINSENRLRRERAAAPAGRTALRKAESAASSPIRAAAAQAKADRLALSKQVLSFLEEQNRRMEEKAREGGKSQEEANLDLLEKGLKELNLCQKISARITAGDKVPDEDLRYLMEHDPDGYRLALAMRRPKKNPKEWESLLEEEDKQGGQSSSVAKPRAGGAQSASAGGVQ